MLFFTALFLGSFGISWVITYLSEIHLFMSGTHSTLDLENFLCLSIYTHTCMKYMHVYINKYNYGTILTDVLFCNTLQSLMSILLHDILEKSEVALNQAVSNLLPTITKDYSETKLFCRIYYNCTFWKQCQITDIVLVFYGLRNAEKLQYI